MKTTDRDVIIITLVTVAFLVFILICYQLPLMGDLMLVGEFSAILAIINIYLTYTKN